MGQPGAVRSRTNSRRAARRLQSARPVLGLAGAAMGTDSRGRVCAAQAADPVCARALRFHPRRSRGRALPDLFIRPRAQDRQVLTGGRAGAASAGRSGARRDIGRSGPDDRRRRGSRRDTALRTCLARHFGSGGGDGTAGVGGAGYKVMRWEKVHEGTPAEALLSPADYPKLSLATTGTHDTDTLAEWWDEAPADERARMLRVLALAPAADS